MDLEESKRALSSTLNNVLAPIVTEGGADSGPACQLREDLASILAQQVPILLKRDLEAFQLAKRFRGLTNHPAYSAATRALLVEASGVAATLMEQVEVDLAEQIEIAERASPSPIREELVDLEGTIVGYPLAEVVGQTVQAVCHSLVESGPRLIESEFESIESLSLYHEPFNSDWGKWEQAVRESLLKIDVSSSDTLYGWLGGNVGAVLWESFLKGFGSLSDIADFVIPRRVDWVVMMFEGDLLYFGRRIAAK